MIAVQKIGKSFMGALGYNLKKMFHPDKDKQAELLGTNFTALTTGRIRQEVDLIRRYRPNLNRYVYHTSLNFSKEEIRGLNNEKLLAIAMDYLEASGYTNNQYLVFRHYDADHPHLHLLVNRITFDGTVVSDSNNYKKSEEIVRSLEIRYDLLKVQSSRTAPRRAPKANEIEMACRTGRSSHKMSLQEKLSRILDNSWSIYDLIRQGEQQGIHFLFNQASTGYVSGVTYFTGHFKVKGQALGKQFKWNEIIKRIDYEQNRDSQAISRANNRTKAVYGTVSEPAKTEMGRNRPGNRKGDHELYTGPAENAELNRGKSAGPNTAGEEDGKYSANSFETEQTPGNNYYHSGDNNSSLDHVAPGIVISDDIDDEAILGRNRRRQKQARTNSR